MSDTAELIAGIESAQKQLSDYSRLMRSVMAQHELIMEICKGTDCVRTDASKDCGQSSRCANCPQRFMVRVNQTT